MSKLEYQTIGSNERDTILETDDLFERIGETVSVAGAVQRIRKLGNLSFLVLRTLRDKLQVVFLGEKNALLEGINEGDFVKIKGTATSNGEAYRGIEVVAEKVEEMNEGGNKEESTDELASIKGRAYFRLCEAVARTFSDYMAARHLTSVPSLRAHGAVYEEPRVLKGFSELNHRQSYLRSLGGVYTVSPGNEELAFEIGYQTSSEPLMREVIGFMAALSSLRDGQTQRELDTLGVDLSLPSAIPAVDFESIRRRVMDVFGYRPPHKEVLLPEEMDLIRRLAKDETGSELLFVTRPPSGSRPAYSMESRTGIGHTEEFSLIGGAGQILSGGLRNHSAQAQEARMVQLGLDPTKMKDYLEVLRRGIPPHGGVVIHMNPLLAEIAKLEGRSRLRFARSAPSIEIQEEAQFDADDFLFGHQRLSRPILEERARRVQKSEDKQVAELMVDEGGRTTSGLPAALVTILPEFAMTLEDIEFLLDLVPTQREKVLSQAPEQVLQYFWSVLGHDHVKSIMKSQQMRRDVRRLSEMGILTDYAQLKFLHEEMLANFDELSAIQSRTIDMDKLTEIAARRIAAKRGSAPNTEERAKIQNYLEREDQMELSGFDEGEAKIVAETLGNGKVRAQVPLTKFTKRLLASRPNTMATVMHTMKDLADAGEKMPIDGTDEEILWEAIDAGCSTPILYRAYTRLRSDKEMLANFTKFLRDNFAVMHKNQEQDPAKVSEKFYKGMEIFWEALGDAFFVQKGNVYPELVHYFYRPINMDITTLSTHLSGVGDQTGDLEEAGFNFGGDHWEADLECYSFVYEEGGVDKVLQYYFTKSSAGFFGKTSAGICTLNDQDLFKRKDHFHINLVDGTTQLVMGNVQGYVINREGKKVILLRAINPSETYVSMGNAQDILKNLVTAVVELAERSSVDEICVGESKGVWHAHSSREPIKAILDLLYDNLEEITLSEPLAIYNFYGIDKTIEKVYKLWGKQPGN